LYANSLFLNGLQFSTEEIVGKSLFEVFPPEIAQQFFDNNNWVIQSNQVLKTVESALLADGTVGEFLVHKFPVISASGQPIVGGMAVDITELKRTEAALRQSEVRYRLLASHFPNGWILLFDRNLRYILADGIGLAALGLSKAEVEGRTMGEVFPLETCEFVEPFYRAALKGKASVAEVPLANRVYLVHYLPIQNDDEHLAAGMVMAQDITDRKQAEEALKLADFSFDRSAVSAVWIGSDAQILRVNEGTCQMLGYSREELQSKYVYEIDPNFPQELWAEHWQTLKQQKTLTFITQLQRKDGSLVPIETTLNYLEFNGKEYNFAFARDISERVQAEAALQQQTERERLIEEITQHVRQSLNLEEILNTAVAEVQHFLQADRVVIYRFSADWSATSVAESVRLAHLSILGHSLQDPCFAEYGYILYQQGQISAIADTETADLQPCYRQLLKSFNVRANLIVPILHEDALWGLLIAQHCLSPHHWQEWEINLLRQLTNQLAIAIQQAELHQQVQQLNSSLEIQVQERTLELQQALEFEALLKQITDKVRDSLDEAQILQTAVQALGIGLNVLCCDIGFYNFEEGSSTVSCEYISSGVSAAKGQTFFFTNLSGVYNQLLQGQYVQFSSLVEPCFVRKGAAPQFTILTCPLMDDQGVLGDLWLYRFREDCFNALEVRLVEQVANQCAIALRQSRLYQVAQAQVTELEQLNKLKDDFLSTVSHELRSPMSNIKMAIQMLEVSLPAADLAQVEGDRTSRYFNILRHECQREINLINDLLDLTRLDSGTEPLHLATMALQIWIPHVLEPFEERIHTQQQQLQIQIPPTLPPITTDLSYLERVLTELLNNACKYTPLGETITVSVKMVRSDQGIEPNASRMHQEAASSLDNAQFQITIRNSGIEIPGSELERIFDRFYRIPNNDPWKHGGTGLGLALVKRLVEQLKGTIVASSDQGQTMFTIQIPLNLGA
ncbi:MAG: PAS domain S-box protein, partial [Kovacikia sp.]